MLTNAYAIPESMNALDWIARLGYAQFSEETDPNVYLNTNFNKGVAAYLKKLHRLYVLISILFDHFILVFYLFVLFV